MREFFEVLAPVFLTLALVVTAWASYVKRSRRYIMVIMIASLGYLGFFHHGCVCSVGSIQNIVLSFLDKTYVVPFIVLTAFLLPLIAAFFWGRVFCGGVCPLGAMQDLINIYRLKIPSWLNPILKLIPLAFLALAVLFLINGAGMLICQYDPFIPFLRLNGSFFMVIFGIIGMFISMFISRAYCRFFCPYSVLLAAISRFSRKSVSITPTECEKCHLCKDACPVEAIEKPTALKSKEKLNTGLMWVIAFVVLIPIWMTAFGVVGQRLSTPIDTVEKIEKLQKRQEKKFTEKRDAQIKELIVESKINNKTGRTVGALFGLFWGLSLVSLTRKRERDSYTANKSDCIVCGRCYNYCPVEVEIRSDEDTSKDPLLGHLSDRFSLSKKKKKVLSLSAILISLLLVGNLFFLVGNLQDVESKNILKQKELSKLKVQIRKNKDDINLKKEYESKELVAQQTYYSTTKKHKNLILFTLISLFLIAGVLKIRKNLSDPSAAIKEEPAGVSPTQSVFTRVGAVLLGVVFIILGIIFSSKPF